jgi:hypothetical protein
MIISTHVLEQKIRSQIPEKNLGRLSAAGRAKLEMF